MVNQLHHISQLLEINLRYATNAYSQVPPSPRSPSPPLIHPATLDQVNFHSGFCHYMGDDVDINTLTMEQYLALIQDNIIPSVVKPEISYDVKFEINSNFMRELRCKIFVGASNQKVSSKKEDKAVEQSKYIGSLEETIIKYYDVSIRKQAANDEWIRKFIENTDSNLRALDTTTRNLQLKADQLTQMVLTNAGERVKTKTKIAGGDLIELSAKEAWETIEDCDQCDKQWKTLISIISDQSIANLKAQLVGNEIVRVAIPRCMSWLGSTDACDEHICSLGMMNNEVGNTIPQSTPQILLSFEEYTPPMTYPEEVEETIGIPMEVEPLNQPQ
ncbi:hypothetical protein Tco_0025617 [Tanacetum coccineum]